MPVLYLDYAASTPLGEYALDTLIKSSEKDFVNPSSSHKLGRKISKEIEYIRSDFLKILEVPKSRRDQKFIFTSSATESNNLLINGLKLKNNDEVLYSLADHPSIVAPVKELIKKGVKPIDYSLFENGQIDLARLLVSIDPRLTKLVIISSVNNQSGGLQDINTISKRIKELAPQIHIHIDASQSFMKYPLSVKDSGVDSISISSHKVHGPKGIAALYVGDMQAISALFYGGGQEYNLRSSTIACSLIKSFHSAVFKDMKVLYTDHDSGPILNEYLRAKLLEMIPQVIFPFPLELTSAYILTFIVPNISSDILLRHLEEKEIFLSSTSACSSKVKGFNPVFKALGINEKLHKNILRLSFCGKNTKEDMDNFLKEFNEIYNDIKQFFR